MSSDLGRSRQLLERSNSDMSLRLLSSAVLASAAVYTFSTQYADLMRARKLADDRRQELERQSLIVDELRHRLKNHIARIRAIARLSARGATDVGTFLDRFDARLQAMAQAQDLAMQASTFDVDLRALIQAELEQGMAPDDAARMIYGAVIRLDTHQTQALSLVVHELVTNAMKFGGLSSKGAGLAVRLFVLPAGATNSSQLWIDWRERYSVDDSDVVRPGFGSRLIEATVETDLSGRFERVFTAEGLHIAIEIPLTAEAEGTTPGALRG
jgi:two-component sensor histidine kinase